MPEAAASYATRLTAAKGRLIVVRARRRCSKWIRYRRNNRAVESKSWFGAVPADEFVNGVIVCSLAAFRSQSVQYCRLRLLVVSSFLGVWAFWAASCAAFRQNAHKLHPCPSHTIYAPRDHISEKRVLRKWTPSGRFANLLFGGAVAEFSARFFRETDGTKFLISDFGPISGTA